MPEDSDGLNRSVNDMPMVDDTDAARKGWESGTTLNKLLKDKDSEDARVRKDLSANGNCKRGDKAAGAISGWSAFGVSSG